ncbi:MAG: hypothetical protein RL172_2529 [Bacteroidota bacterium]|jgi:hypothetical protein
MKENIAISQRENWQPTQLQEALWWLSTGEKTILINSPADRSRFSIIGLCVLCTWLFASIAWGYFFSTVTGSAITAIAGGLLMGFIILCIDRALIKGISKNNRQQFLPVLFRALLAITIGTFMAQPALLYMFRKEIKLQVAADNEQKSIQNRLVLDSMYKKQKDELLQNKANLQTQLTERYQQLMLIRNNYLAETDGSGGTGKVGIKDIAIAKRNEYEKAEAGYKELQATLQPNLSITDKKLQELDAQLAKDQQLYASQFNDGFLTQIEALNNLVQKNSALQIRYYLLIAILVLIELMPVIAKLVIPAGVYDDKILLQERMDKEIAASNMQKEQQLKELYNQLALQNDQEAIEQFFEITRTERAAKLKSFIHQWQQDNHKSFDGLWEQIKKELLTKQEH